MRIFDINRLQSRDHAYFLANSPDPTNKIIIASLLVIFAIGLYATPEAFADHENETHVTMAENSGVPGCEETAEGCFLPSTVTIAAGESVIWENTDYTMHFATSGIDMVPDGVFDSGMLNPGQSWSYTFEEAGTYPYYCMVHAWMVGTVIVGDGESQPQLVPSATFTTDKQVYGFNETILVTGIVSDYNPTDQDRVIASGVGSVQQMKLRNSSGGFSFEFWTSQYEGIQTLKITVELFNPRTNIELEKTVQVVAPEPTTTYSANLVTMAENSGVPGCEETSFGCFIPSTVTIAAGESVTWANTDNTMHFATSGIDMVPDGVFDSGMMNPGDTFSFTFEEAGTYPYYCMVHAWMVGTVIVGEGGTTESTSSEEAEAAAAEAEAAAAEAAAEAAAAEAAAAEAEAAARIAEAEAEAAAAEAESAARIAEAEAAARIAAAEAAAKAAEEAAEQTIASLSPVNEKIEITMDFSNETGNPQTFAFLVQIKNENNLTISLSNVTGILGAGQTLDQVLSYIPTESGTYTIEKYLWSDLSNPTALIDEKETFAIQVT